MNDISVPFISLFILEYIDVIYSPYKEPKDIEQKLSDSKIILKVEADTYYCFSKVLNGILDNYTDKTPGINQSIQIIKQLIQNVDRKLFDHLED